MADMLKLIVAAEKTLLASSAALEKQAAQWLTYSKQYAKNCDTLTKLQWSEKASDVKKAKDIDKSLKAEQKRAKAAIKKLEDEWLNVAAKLDKTLKYIELRAEGVKELHDEHRKLMDGLVKGLKAALQKEAEERHRALLEALHDAGLL
jgi:hypothetical protein